MTRPLDLLAAVTRWRPSFLLKLAAAVAGIAFLVGTGRLPLAPLLAVLGDPATLGGMIALQVVLLMNGVLRWWILLRAVDRRAHPYRALLSFYWIGQFFSCFAPSTLTTDATRVAYVRRTGEATTTAVVTSLVVERTCGLAVAFLLALTLARDALPMPVDGRALAWVVGIGAVLVAAGAAWLRSARGATARTRLAPVATGVRAARAMKASVAAALCLSLASHAMKVACLWLAVRQVHGTDLSLGWMFGFAPIGFLTEALPLAPGGFGTTHLAFEYLFAGAGMAGGAALFNAYFAVRLLVSAVGGVIWAAGAPGRARPAAPRHAVA